MRLFYNSRILSLAIAVFACQVSLEASSSNSKDTATDAFSPMSAFGQIIPITNPEDGYSAWGTIGKLTDGTLITVYSGARKAHVDPYGQVRMNLSRDGGLTWEKPQTLYNGTLDDRDSGFLLTKDGTQIVTWFTSLQWRDNLNNARKRAPGSSNAWKPELIAEWEEQEAKLTPEVLANEWGAWAMRSTDGGVTWSKPINTIVSSPHGPVQLDDGTILYVGKEMPHGARLLSVLSKDDGESWEVIGEIKPASGHSIGHYHEVHAMQTGSGKIIAQIRDHNSGNSIATGKTLQTESTDGGRTWVPPYEIGINGFPTHLLKLNDGRLLTTYSDRRNSSIRARVSDDDGKTWSEPIVMPIRPLNWDMGYPSTVELEDGTLVTVWYESEHGGLTRMKSLRWRMK